MSKRNQNLNRTRRNRSFEQMESRQLMAADFAGAALPTVDLGGPANVEQAPVEFAGLNLPGRPGPIDPGPILPGPIGPGPLGPINPGPILPGPINPGPILPGPILPGPILPGPFDPGPILPIFPVTEFTGTWTNVDSSTRGVTKIQIRSDWSGDHTVEAWGSCTPTDCEWGTTDLDLLGTSVSDTTPDYAIGRWEPGFKDTVVTVEKDGDDLIANVYSMYNDSSGRNDRHDKYLLTDSGDMVEQNVAMDDGLADVIVGGWVNRDRDARGITELNVAHDGSGGMDVNVWGSCSPEDCDWNSTDVHMVGTSIVDDTPHLAIAEYDQGFATRFMTTELVGSELIVETYTVFEDGSSRSNYVSSATMWKLGDANHDGHFNTSDLVMVMAAGEYEDGIEDNSFWSEGDWDRDGDFTTGDLVKAFASGGYEADPVIFPPFRIPELEIKPPFELPGGGLLVGGLKIQAIDELFGLGF